MSRKLQESGIKMRLDKIFWQRVMTCLDSFPISGLIPPLDFLPRCVWVCSIFTKLVYSGNINAHRGIVLFVPSSLKNERKKKQLRDVYSKMWICVVFNPLDVASVVNEQHMVDKDVGFMHINAHVAFKDLQLLWKHNTVGPWDGSTPKIHPITGAGLPLCRRDSLA